MFYYPFCLDSYFVQSVVCLCRVHKFQWWFSEYFLNTSVKIALQKSTSIFYISLWVKMINWTQFCDFCALEYNNLCLYSISLSCISMHKLQSLGYMGKAFIHSFICIYLFIYLLSTDRSGIELGSRYKKYEKHHPCLLEASRWSLLMGAKVI